MALIPCRECGSSVSSEAPVCPICGIKLPGSKGTGTIAVTRKPSMTGALYSVRVTVDGVLAGELKSGVTLNLEVEVGDREIGVAGGGLSNSSRVTVKQGATVSLETRFSNWGVLGGGLRLDQA